MRRVLLGGSGLRVSDLCLGTMTFGTDWGWGADEDECRRIYTAYRDAGGTFVDTANLYTDGASEEIVGRLVAGERDAVVIGTKYTMTGTRSDLNSGGSHRKSLRQSLEASLRRLGTDHVDVLWVHAWDRCTPIEETLRALDDVVRQGKALAIGVSNTPAWEIARADAIARLRNTTPFCAVQFEYSLAERTADRELLPMASSLGLARLAWSPLAMGLLASGASRRGRGERTPTPDQQRALAAASSVATELGTSSARVAIAWVRRRGLIPVLGARTEAQILDNLAAADLELDDEHVQRLDAATMPVLGQPHDFLRDRWSVLSPEGLNEGPS